MQSAVPSVSCELHAHICKVYPLIIYAIKFKVVHRIDMNLLYATLFLGNHDLVQLKITCIQGDDSDDHYSYLNLYILSKVQEVHTMRAVIAG